jgi:FG-GAP-like repeat
MRVRSYISGLVVLLLTLGVYSVSVSPSRRDGAPSPGRTQSSSSTSWALSDLDGDGLADLVLLDPGGLQHNIELHLSRADERVALPLSTAAGGDGSLSAQDIDGDGDTDLLWQGSLPSHAVMVWLNDGAGRFECLCPPAPRDWGAALSSPGVNASRRRRPDSALSPERTPAPGYALTPRWDFHVVATRGSHRPEPVWSMSCLKQLPPTRSPPLLLC